MVNTTGLNPNQPHPQPLSKGRGEWLALLLCEVVQKMVWLIMVCLDHWFCLFKAVV